MGLKNIVIRNNNLGTDASLSVYEFCALSEGRKLDAIRLYRARRNVGLAEGRKAVEAIDLRKVKEEIRDLVPLFNLYD